MPEVQDIVILAMSLTPFAKAVDALLRLDHSTTLQTFINVRRAQGQTWSQIASALTAETRGDIEVTRTTIQNWHDDMQKVAS
jgi:hypothetical protein